MEIMIRKTVIAMAFTLVAMGVSADDRSYSARDIEKLLVGSSTEAGMKKVRTAIDVLDKRSTGLLSAEDATEAQTRITGQLIVSYYEEMLFHLSRISTYYGFEDALMLDKLRRKNEFRNNAEAAELLDDEDYVDVNFRKIDQLHSTELSDAREYLETKAHRIRYLCSSLQENSETIAKNGVGLPSDIVDKLEKLRGTNLWEGLAGNYGEGQKALMMLEDLDRDTYDNVNQCMSSSFAYLAGESESIDAEVLRRIVSQYGDKS